MAQYGKTDAHGNPVHHTGGTTGGYGTTGGTGTGGGIGGQMAGLTDKIKQKLPGGQKTGQSHSTTTTTTTTGHGQQHQQKKGVVQKIKEMLPGQNKY